MSKKTLNENGKLVCMMAVTMAAGIMSNPAYNREPLDSQTMLKLAFQMVQDCGDIEWLIEK